MNWLEMFAIFVISILAYLITTVLFGIMLVMLVDAINDHDGFPWGAWAFGAFIFVVVVLAWANGLPLLLKM